MCTGTSWWKNPTRQTNMSSDYKGALMASHDISAFGLPEHQRIYWVELEAKKQDRWEEGWSANKQLWLVLSHVQHLLLGLPWKDQYHLSQRLIQGANKGWLTLFTIRSLRARTWPLHMTLTITYFWKTFIMETSKVKALWLKIFPWVSAAVIKPDFIKGKSTKECNETI